VRHLDFSVFEDDMTSVRELGQRPDVATSINVEFGCHRVE
jgi:hypothetical protein